MTRSRVFVLAALALAGCDLLRDSPESDRPDAARADAAIVVDGAPIDTGYPPPRRDAVKRIGGPDTLDVAAWNVRNFGSTSTKTAGLLADLIASLDLDLVVVEEVASIDAWNELVARLPEHDGVLSSHVYTPTEYQKIGVLYRSGTLEKGTIDLLFETKGPRPPLAVSFRYDDGTHAAMTFEIIGVHLKAKGDGIEQRRAEIVHLDEHVRTQITGGGEDEIILLGDFNQEIVTDQGKGVMAPMLADSDNLYDVRTLAAAQTTPTSYIGLDTIDHVVTTRGLADELGSVQASILAIDAQVPGYRTDVSDHRPVFLAIPLVPRRNAIQILR